MINTTKENFSILKSYANLVGSYLADEIDALAFEKQYLSKFKDDSTVWISNEFEILNAIFTDLDAFCYDPKLRDDEDLDENQLKERTGKNFQKLKAIIENSPKS